MFSSDDNKAAHVDQDDLDIDALYEHCTQAWVHSCQLCGAEAPDNLYAEVDSDVHSSLPVRALAKKLQLDLDDDDLTFVKCPSCGGANILQPEQFEGGIEVFYDGETPERADFVLLHDTNGGAWFLTKSPSLTTGHKWRPKGEEHLPWVTTQDAGSPHITSSTEGRDVEVYAIPKKFRKK